MISYEVYKCPICKQERYQRVVFLGGEFSYQCPVCLSLHLFYENLFPRFQANFDDKSKWSRFVGTYSTKEKTIVNVANPGIAEHFALLCEAFYNPPKIKSAFVKRRILTDKKDRGEYFIGSCFHDHFQEAFRGLYHLHGHIRSKRGPQTYNILILPDIESLSFVKEETSKQRGIDELWLVPFNKKMRWPYVHSATDIEIAYSGDREVTILLDSLQGMGEVVTKRAGPVPNGRKLLKELLEPEVSNSLISSKGKPLDDKYVAILLHQDDNKRAGLKTKEQIAEVARAIEQKRVKQILLVTTEQEKRWAIESCKEYLYLPKVSDQALFYRDHCYAIIASNCSGCNLPALYDLPIFSFVKEREFPDDFYCFARMASTYNKEMMPWYGDLEKVDNIVEFKVEANRKTALDEKGKQLLEVWYKEHVKAKQTTPEGFRELEKGFADKCPNCSSECFTRETQLVYSDFCCLQKCWCGTFFVSYRGLTSLSKKAVFQEEENRYQESLQKAKEARKLIREKGVSKTYTKEHSYSYSYNKSKKDIVFYCMKPSIADLYYMLPSIMYLKEKHEDEYNIVAIIPEQYIALVPKQYVDRIYGVTNISPREYHTLPYTEAHFVVEQLLEKTGGVFTSNVPGILPYNPNVYRHFRSKIAREVEERTTDLVLFCRLVEVRRWPSEETLKELMELCEKHNWSYYILVFPYSDQQELPSFFSRFSGVVANPTIKQQLEIVGSSKVCLTPHGASETIPCITNTPILELEILPNWWKQKELQPLRFGLELGDCIKLEAKELDQIPVKDIESSLEKLIVRHHG